MKKSLERIRVAGYKSIRDQEIELRALNVLIGANGAGKSNFIDVFRLLNRIVDHELQLTVAQRGGADRLLHFGRKRTDEILLQLDFPPNVYSCRLIPTDDDSLIFGEETDYFQGEDYPEPYEESLGSGHKETNLLTRSQSSRRKTIADHVLSAIKSWKLYHFHDTSREAKVKQTGDLHDNDRLRPDAGNLAAFLYRLRETEASTYRDVVDTVRMVAPFFADFDLEPDRLNPEKIRLEWREKGSEDYFDAHALSDGTLRFIALTTLLLQPELPATVLLDEPELGLHPYAIHLLAELLSQAAERTQVVVATQSVTLVNQLSPEDVLVVDRDGGESIFRRPSPEEVDSWLDDYALGELWEKNLLGGRPGR
jgi:predicted ATPase